MLWTPDTLHGISIPWVGGGGECLSYPPPPGISVIFQLGWVPSGKNICVKNVVARYYNAKDNFFLR